MERSEMHLMVCALYVITDFVFEEIKFHYLGSWSLKARLKVKTS
jgi:hypothetical protein